MRFAAIVGACVWLGGAAWAQDLPPPLAGAPPPIPTTPSNPSRTIPETPLATPLAAPAETSPDTSPTSLRSAIDATTNAMDRGDTTRARLHAERAVRIARDPASDPLLAAWALGSLAELQAADRSMEAAALYRDALRRLEAAGLTAPAPWGAMMGALATIEAAAGQTAAAAARMERLRTVARTSGWRDLVYHVEFAHYLATGDYAAARVALAATIRTTPHILRPIYADTYGQLTERQEVAEAQGDSFAVRNLVMAKRLILEHYAPDVLASQGASARTVLFQSFSAYFAESAYARAADALRAWLTVDAPMTAEDRAWLTDFATQLTVLTEGSTATAPRILPSLGFADIAAAAVEAAFGVEDPRTQAALLVLAATAAAEGDLATAEDAYRTAAALSTAPDAHMIDAHLADVLDRAGNPAAAEASYARFQARHAAAGSPLPPEVEAEILMSWALLRHEAGDMPGADALLSDVIARLDHTDGQPSAQTRARALMLQASAQHATGSASQALLGRALAAVRTAFPAGAPERAVLLQNAGDLLMAQGAQTQALDLLREAVDIFEAQPGLLTGNAAATVETLAQVELLGGDRESALSRLRGLAPFRMSDAQWRAAGDHVGYFNLLAWLELEAAGSLTDASFSALQWTHVTRSATALAGMEAQLRAALPRHAAALRQHADLTAQHAQIVAETRRALDAGRETGRLAALRRTVAAELRAAGDEIAALGADVAGMGRPRPLSLADVQARLAPGEAMVTFLLPGLRPDVVSEAGPSSNRVVVVTHNSIEVGVVSEPLRTGLRARLKRFRCEVAVSDPGCGPEGGAAALRGSFDLFDVAPVDQPEDPRFDFAEAYALYDALFGDVAGTLQEQEHVIIVPPADLLGLPFAALVTKPGITSLKGAPWMLRDHAISILPSISALDTLRLPRAPRVGPPRFLGVGDPVIGTAGSVACAALDLAAVRSAPAASGTHMQGWDGNGLPLADPEVLRRLSRLPDAACEVDAIAQSFSPSQQQLLLQEAATEAAIKTLHRTEALSTFDVLVFATHGLTAGEAGAAAPGLVLTPPAIASSEDDGLLTAAEIATLRLSADLVILSACNTAAGDRGDADGLSGLARAFFHAGARALLVTHWAVYSTAAVEATTGFFEAKRAAPEIGESEALRRSLLAIIERPNLSTHRLHPAYWAAFTLVGAG